jgi:hypothetical protein
MVVQNKCQISEITQVFFSCCFLLLFASNFKLVRLIFVVVSCFKPNMKFVILLLELLLALCKEEDI